MHNNARSRRTILLTAGCAAVVGTMPGRLVVAAPSFQGRNFEVFRKGRHIGIHTIRFEEADGGAWRVTHEIDLAVKIAFVTAFRYHQEAQDIWRDAVLVGTQVETNDDGDKFRVVCAAVDGKLSVDGPKGGYRVDLGTMTDLSFWNEDVTRQKQVIDAKDGELIDIHIEAAAQDRVEIGGQMISARRYRISDSRKRSGQIWFDQQGNWIKAEITTRGELLDYRLVV